MKGAYMMIKRMAAVFAMAVLCTCQIGSLTVMADDVQGNVPQGGVFSANGGLSDNLSDSKYTHGSSVTVTEDELKGEDSIPDTYDVNEATQADAKDGAYSKLFDTENIQDVNVTIDTDNWNYLLQNANDKPTVLADSVSVGDEKIQYVGIKTKGNLTLSSVWNSDSDRFSFSINVGKYIKKKNGYSANQNFYGLTKFVLNDIYGDASLMKEYLSYELMTKMGVDTPYYCLVNLYINGEFYGVYMMVEAVDSSLTERTAGTSSDFFTKPESLGGDLVYLSGLDSYLGSDGEYVFPTDSYPSGTSDILSSYNGLWENDEDTFDDIKGMLSTVFKWMKTLNSLSNAADADTDGYKEELSKICDVDKLIRYFAVNTYLVNLDSYQSEKEQNYALYIDENGYAEIYPWDYNFSFGGYGCSSASDMVNFSISDPVSNTELSDRPLLNVILKNDDYRALFYKYLKDCTIIASQGGTTSDNVTYSKNNFADQIDDYSSTLLTDYAADPTAFYTADQYKNAISSLKQLISDRSRAVISQLSGNTEPVETTVDLSSIGSANAGGGMNGKGGAEFTGETTTATDDASGIKFTGTFVSMLKLSVVEETDGDDVEIAKNTAKDREYKVYKITSSMNGNENGDMRTFDGKMPTQGMQSAGSDFNGGSAVTDDTSSDSDASDNNSAADTGAVQGNGIKNGMDMPSSAYGPSGTMHGNGEDMAVTVSFPIASNMENIDVYEITDGKAELLSSEQDGDYISVDTKNPAAAYILVYDETAQNDVSEDASLPKTGTSPVYLYVFLGLIISCAGVVIICMYRVKHMDNRNIY
jgi:spore coat protein CotH